MELRKELAEGLKNHCHEDVESEEMTGIVFNLFAELREIISKYNDTLKGKCAICLEPFAQDEDELENGRFTDRKDLVRIDGCFHRFRLVCLYRYWFMRRHIETDEFGNKIEYKIPEVKKCPVCRREVKDEDIQYITSTFKSTPNLKRELSYK